MELEKIVGGILVIGGMAMFEYGLFNITGYLTTKYTLSTGRNLIFGTVYKDTIGLAKKIVNQEGGLDPLTKVLTQGCRLAAKGYLKEQNKK